PQVPGLRRVGRARPLERPLGAAEGRPPLHGDSKRDGEHPTVIRRMTTALVLVGAVLVAVVLTGASGGSSGKTFKVAFDNAFGLTKGCDLRVAGVTAGSTNGFKLSKGPECQHPGIKAPPRTCAIVEAEITQPGFRSPRQ